MPPLIFRLPLIAVFGLALHGKALAAAPPAGVPAVPAVDAPELAALGPLAVGYQALTLVQPGQVDVLAARGTSAAPVIADRVLPTDVWYPAEASRGCAARYAGALTGEDGKDVAFAVQGLAVAGARPATASRGESDRGGFPIVILAHGYAGTPTAMTWLAENLASKGYVVVAPHFRDPPYGDAAGFVGPLARRPLDIAFVAAEAVRRAGTGAFRAADPSRIVLIGYSMGGYGVLTAAGAPLDPKLGPLTRGALMPFTAGSPRAGEIRVPRVAAVVAISPAGLFAGAEAWGPKGLGAITAPLLVIAGGQDRVVGYDPGAKTLWDQAVGAPRYLLTLVNAGHSIGMNPAPETMRGRLWDQDWFEDPVWRKERVIGVQLHVITAFLNRYVKGDPAAGAYLDVPSPVSNDGVWPAKPGAPYAAYSPGVAPSTIWKGFQRAHSAGLELRFAPAR